MSTEGSFLQKPLLFLANYAPIEGSKPEPGHYPSYHRELFQILRQLGYSVTPSRDGLDVLRLRSQVAFIFSLLNRVPYRGSEILPSALAEYVGVPYLGSTPHIRALADDKYLAKLFIRGLGISTPESVAVDVDQRDFMPNFEGPFFVKPRSGAASHFVGEESIQTSNYGLRAQVRHLQESVGDVLVERFVPGTNISLPIIGGDPPTILPPYMLQSTKNGQVVTYEQKRRLESGLKRSIVRDQGIVEHLTQVGGIIYDSLRPIDYLRVEFRLPPGEPPTFTELNICCNISSRSGFALSAAEAGLDHKSLVERILAVSFERQKVGGQTF